MTKIIDPWGSGLVEDYVKIIKDFGLDMFDSKKFPEPNRLMRRHVVFAGRDIERIAECIKEKKPYYVLTGIMPSAEKLHFGNKMVIEQVKYFQDHGAKTYVLIADLEAAATRGITLEEAQKRAAEFHIPAWIALGLNPKKTNFYYQSENKDVMHLAYKFAKKITLNEFRAIYGQADPSRIIAALTQAGDILYPQLKERMPGIIPVGIDQDPHIRLTRDIVRRSKADKFFLPSGIYHKFTPSLGGEVKMSKSQPQSCIELPEDPANVKKKIMKAVTGGRETLELHRKLGAEVEKCMVFEMLKQHLVEDDKELDKIYKEYKSGKMTSGEIKQLCCEKMESFLKDFTKNIDKARKQVDKLKFIRFG
ncbi:MAG: tryptophan--tRNA ligase [Candidatus Woesearchaeota archaeon]